jgi:hypothetical protein
VSGSADYTVKIWDLSAATAIASRELQRRQKRQQQQLQQQETSETTKKKSIRPSFVEGVWICDSLNYDDNSNTNNNNNNYYMREGENHKGDDNNRGETSRTKRKRKTRRIACPCLLQVFHYHSAPVQVLFEPQKIIQKRMNNWYVFLKKKIRHL